MLPFNEVPVGRKQGASGDAEMRSLKRDLLSRPSKELTHHHGIAGAMEEKVVTEGYHWKASGAHMSYMLSKAESSGGRKENQEVRVCRE
jgi:hypothetical protein